MKRNLRVAVIVLAVAAASLTGDINGEMSLAMTAGLGLGTTAGTIQ